VSVAIAADAVPPGAIHRVLGGTDQPDFAAYERKAEGIRRGLAALDRIEGSYTAAQATAAPSRARYACADGAVFAVTFDVAGARAVIEFLGREPIVLPRVEAGTHFLYSDGQQSLRGEGEEAFWQTGGTAPVACTLAANATPLRLAPGSYPLFDPAAKPADDWSRLLFDLMPAINACLRAPVGDLPGVVKAWPMNRGMVGVALQNIDGGRHECIAVVDGSAVDQVELLRAEAERAPGEGNPIFTPADGAYPGSACFSHERVAGAGGGFLGWLSVRTC
jgi:putative lipoprotein